MTTVLLNECGDWAIRSGRTVLIGGADEIRQRWLIHIRTFLGEWFLDQNIGVPYFDPPPGVTVQTGQPVTSKALTRRTLKDLFAAATAQTPGVLVVESVIVNELDAANRTADVTVTCKIDADEDSAVFRYSGSIPPDGCDPQANQDLPLQIQSGVLEAWFDAQDLTTIAFASGPGGPIDTVQNKAGAGFLDNLAASPVLWSTGAFGSRGGFQFLNTLGQALKINGIPAIRNAADLDDNPYTIFTVKDATAAFSGTGNQYTVLGLDGVNFVPQTERIEHRALDAVGPGYLAQLGLQRDGGPVFGLGYSGGAVTAPKSRDTMRVLGTDPGMSVELTGSAAAGVQTFSTASSHTPQLAGGGNVGADVNGANFFEGFLGEILIYRGYLTDDDRDSVNAWLDAKWGM